MPRYIAIPTHEDSFGFFVNTDEEAHARVTELNSREDIGGLKIVELRKIEISTIWKEEA
jgi:hypothetical protein